MNKSRRLPEALWDSVVSGGRSTISIVHVVDRSKLWRLSRQRADHVSEETARGVIPITTVDYKGLVRELKTSRRNGRWHLRPRGPPAPKAFFLIEVDPDGSADFFLALYAAVEFSLSVTEEQTQAAIRLATMSWESVDEIYSRLVYQIGREITCFVLPGNFERYIQICVGTGEEEQFKALVSRLEQLGSGDQHTVVYFSDGPGPPPRWKEDEWEEKGWTREKLELDNHGRFPAQDESAGSVLLQVPCGTRGFGMLGGDGYAHIIPSSTRQRLIFDMETRQVVRVDLRVSQSERRQQLSWVDRTTCQRSRVCVYLDVESRMAHSRRRDILNNQLAGLIAGLAQFEGWPSRIRSLSRLIALLAQDGESQGMINQTVQRLELQGVLRIETPQMDRAISLQGGIPNTFLALLPLVNYDTRLAYLLVQPSDPMATWVKIQLAAALSIGLNNLLSIDMEHCSLEDLSYIKIARDIGYAAKLAPFGTLWTALGLMKRGKYEFVHRDNSRPFVDDKVVLSGSACQEWEGRCREIHGVLSPGQPPVDVLDEIGTLTEEQADGFHWDCLRAFAFQIAVLTFPRDPRIPVVHDIVSGVELLVNIALLTVDFDTIKENDPECMVGFYTTLSRPRSAPGTMISDWNWIPSSVWKRWRRSLEADGSDRWALLANRYTLGRNSDEAKRDRGRKPGNKKKLQVKPNAFCFVEANKPEPLEASIANKKKPSFAATVGTSSGSKLGPPEGIEDSIWAPAGSASKAAVKPVSPRPQPVAPQAMETIPKDAFCLSEMVKALPPLKPFGQGQVEPVNGFQHQGRFYPKSPKQPDRVHREKMWRLAFPGLPWADGGEPFRIELSEQMDFGFLVWGLNGAHWNVAKVARVLDLGFVNDRSPGNLDRIKDLWSSLCLWFQGIRNGQMIPSPRVP
ncbi:hypothetical protein BHE90_012987 [Fusarium euwallaceae]|uniref:Uncharacterized protein n=1 Tax=Fusarium euwallaceae TaxID=1147111 RepID=A0A430LA39_9HYPO|nr:hypothetical protein BHE90_012987 [Fusarium euwallaceae]